MNGEWRTILCRSLNHPDTIRGTEVGWAIVDETQGTTKEAVDIINSRVRATEQLINQNLYTSTVDDPTHWMYDLFVENFDPAVMHVEYATSYDNPHLPAEFVEMLRSAEHDAQSVLDEGMGGAADARVAEACRAEGRAIVTLDLDFADIRAYPPNEQAGVIVLRVDDQRRQRLLTVFEQVVRMLETEDVRGHLWLIDERGVRVRGGEGTETR